MSATINIVGTSAPNPAQTLKNVFAVTDTRGNHRTQEAHSCASPTGNLNGVGNSAEAEPTKKTCVYEYRRKRHAEWLKRHQHTAGQRKGEDAPISVPPLDFDNKRIRLLHGFGMFNLSRSLKYLDDIVKLKLEQLHGPFVCALLYATPCLQAYDVTSRSPSSVYSHRTSASPTNNNHVR